MRLRLRALERPQRHLGSLAFLADASSHEEILLPIWPDVCHYDGWSPNISARDRVPTVAKSVDFAPRDYRKPARWGQTNSLEFQVCPDSDSDSESEDDSGRKAVVVSGHLGAPYYSIRPKKQHKDRSPLATTAGRRH